MILKQNDN